MTEDKRDVLRELMETAARLEELKAAAHEAIEVDAFKYHDRHDLKGNWQACDICRAYQQMEATLERLRGGKGSSDA